MTTLIQNGHEYLICSSEEWLPIRREKFEAGFRPIDLTTGLFAGTALVKTVNKIEDATSSRPLVFGRKVK